MNLIENPLPILFICGFGRPSMQYAQALFDSHPDVLVIPAPLKFYLEWKRLGCSEEWSPKRLVEAWSNSTNLRWELENKVPSGVMMDHNSPRRIFVDREVFREELIKLLSLYGTERKTFFLALHQAYIKAANLRDGKWGLIVENTHTVQFFDEMLADFPQAKLLVLIREPKSALDSCLRRYKHAEFSDPGRFYADLIAEGYVRTLDAQRRFSETQLRIVKSEELNANTASVMQSIANWAGVSFSETLLEATRAGQKWLSVSNHYSLLSSSSFERKIDIWLTELAMIDFILDAPMSLLGYKPLYNSALWRILGLLSIFFPSKYHFFAKGKYNGFAEGDSLQGGTLFNKIYNFKKEGKKSIVRLASLVLLLGRVGWFFDIMQYKKCKIPSRPYNNKIYQREKKQILS